MTKRWSISLILGLLSSVVLVACAVAPTPQVVQQTVVVEKEVTKVVEKQAAEESTSERIKRTGVVRVGFFYEPPWAYVDPETHKLSGETPEVAHAVLNRVFDTELQLEGILVSEFGSLIPGLQAGRFDMIASGLYIRPERCEQVLFADPEGMARESLVVKEGNPYNLHSYEDIRDSTDVKVGAAEGGAQYLNLKSVGIPEERIVLFQDYEQAFEALRAGRIDAVAGPAVSMEQKLRVSGSGFERAKPFQDPIIDGQPYVAYFGAAFRKEDKDLRDAFNQELNELKESRELLEIMSPFGWAEEDIPWNVTAEELCNP